MKELTFEDIYNEEMNLHAKLNSDNKIAICIETDAGMALQDIITKAQWENLAYFARFIVACDKKIQSIEEG